ncbi:imidazole glycerol phosphate synthase subunit HisH [Prochlorococcus marinus]|uniref:Imidazole glycerol phosphate synthase subunit HisH n=1 Tax=Prochlorococcus marinus XMU1408 TaxID=2213228 RepID=A0A318R285_PROMR|nr:imidazole glycerol phosphate synthase subunit HisH [Prochlorococcus marinus]MBW3042299.1 imidazole glycerol phosphate synthase subunit HisH [Prochlorococcus marinus str. XMU1408]PYE01686.1 imidazole glycerol phosphate synthase subunit HisH [Prochlorococcus marinus XMU1408]
MAKIGLIDYGMGNLFSVQQAFKRLNQPLEIVSDIKRLNLCDALILPGVGAFDPAMKNLRNTDLIPSIIDWVNNGKPLLGICLGLQLLFESSDEGILNGLGVIKGHIHKLPEEQNERIPHIGWSPINKINECPILENFTDSNWMYFVHSYSACPLEQKNTVATTKFGETDFSSIVWHKNTGACQFHPEKSGIAGQKLILNWINWLRKGKY